MPQSMSQPCSGRSRSWGYMDARRGGLSWDWGQADTCRLWEVRVLGRRGGGTTNWNVLQRPEDTGWVGGFPLLHPVSAAGISLPHHPLGRNSLHCTPWLPFKKKALSGKRHSFEKHQTEQRLTQFSPADCSPAPGQLLPQEEETRHKPKSHSS